MRENEKHVYEKLSGKTPTGYRINELIPFSYPLRKLKLDVLVNKAPDGSLLKVYNVMLRTIQAGFNRKELLFDFLGLGDKDEFMERELFQLREKGFLDLVGENWMVTESGNQFLRDNTILRVEETETFEFLIDGMSGAVLSCSGIEVSNKKLPKFFEPEIRAGNRSPELLNEKFQELADVYKSDNQGKAYLLNYSPENINYDGEVYRELWMVEYIPAHGKDDDPYLEVREFNSLKIDKKLTGKFNGEYKYYLGQLTDSERMDFEVVKDAVFPPVALNQPAIERASNESKVLTIWETKQQFIEALSTVKKRILIESPWIKRATLEYLPAFEKILNEGKQLYILYGIREKDEHDFTTLNKLQDLKSCYTDNFHLIHLPSHLDGFYSRLTGTHRKLVIKDDDYYLTGSFNFLSFRKQEHQEVANEETMLIHKGVKERWEGVFMEYQLYLTEPSRPLASYMVS